MPADYPQPVTHVYLNNTDVMISGISREQAENILSVLKSYYNNNQDDTFSREEYDTNEGFVISIAAHHLKEKEQGYHSLMGLYTEKKQSMQLIYQFKK